MPSPTLPLSTGQKRIATVILGTTLLAFGCSNGGTAQQGTAVDGGTGGRPSGGSPLTTPSQTTSTALDSSHGGNGQFSPRSSDDGTSPEGFGGFGGAVSSKVSSSGGVNASSSGSTQPATSQGGTSTSSDTSSRAGTWVRTSSTLRGGAGSTLSDASKGGAAAATSSKGIGGGIGGSSANASSGTQCNLGKWDGKTKPVPLTLSGNTFAHDPTMIFANGTYYRFWTGDNIPSAKSTNLTSWQNASAVFKNGYASWVEEWLAGVSGETFNFPWAPDVSFFNGEYHIYSTFSAKFGDNISCITHLTTADIATGNWTDHGPVICTKGSENYNAIDADLGLDASGAPWLAFGSFWDGIMGMPLNSDGSSAGNKLTRLARASEIEAPVLFYRCGYYYLFVTWGLCCPGEGRSVSQLTYRVAVGRSQNIMGPYVDRSGKAMLDGGGTLMVQGDKTTWAAAGHSDVLVSGDKIYHLYHAYRQANGEAQLRIVEMPFDDEQWPVPGGP